MNISFLDPVEGKFPARRALSRERVLHIHLNAPGDPQNGLVRALTKLGKDGYQQIDWMAHGDRRNLQENILGQARNLRPTLVFMQLQTPNVVDVETIRALRSFVDHSCVIATWCGDVANNNSPWSVGWQVPLAQAVDLTLHTSMTHVDALRQAGVSNAGYLQIGYDEEQYRPNFAIEKKHDVVFLGNRYYSAQYLSTMQKHDADLRDHIVDALKGALGERFQLFGSGFGLGTSAVSLSSAHEAYWTAKVGLNVSLCNFFPAYSSDRIFRILGCGAACLTKRFPLMSSYGLANMQNCLIWDTPEEAIALARRALDSGNWKAIGEEGARLAREHHTWDVRMLELMPYLAAVRSARS